MGLLLVRFLFPATSEEVERNETPALSRNEVQVIRIEDTGSIGIAEAVPVADAALSENTAAEESAGEAETVSEDEVPAVSEDEAVSENEAAPEEEAPEEEEPVDEDLPADTAAPIVLAVNAAPTIKIGDTFDVHKYIGYADDVDRHVEMEVSGEVNTAAEGTYPLQITLRDDAGHSTSQKMTVKVVTEFPPSTGYVGKTEAFSDFINTYKTENTSVGIDISRWQEDVDFEKVKAAGCEFVYMRIGGLDEGELYTDRYYEYNIAAAKAAGLKVGIYWHAEEGNARQVKASVDYLMTVLNGQELDFPIAYDWEDFMRFENHEMNLYDLNNNLDVFVSEVEKHGYTGCLYNSKYYLDTVWTSASKHPVWLAYYVSSLSDHSRYFMWQHGCTGRIDGVNGDVDLDVLYHDVPMQ
ncbi:MAG: hypothetical protein IK115_11945 [Lachnospiraceae bacterium]|nr:hypothetical protein [Lachnospiraceae bacterium]